MTKPVIVTRATKGSALTWTEGDSNFTNLQNATISVAADGGTTQAIDLNDTVTIAGGTGLTSAATTKTITLNLDNTAVTAGSYTKASITVDAQGRITSASNGSADFATSDARSAISVTDNGGDGSLSYSSSTGVISYTGPSASDVRAHFSAGTGITITDGAIATTITQYADSNARSAISVTDAGGEGSLSYNSSTGVVTYTGPDLSGYQATSAKGQANGYASLDSSGLVPSNQLPSYVDDVIEAANYAALPGTGATGKIYVTLDNGKIYRWSGSAYVEISASPGSTDSVTEGSTNLYFTTQRARDAFSASTGITITNGAVAIANTAVTAGSYTYASLTVDAQGRITAASNGTTPLVSGGALGTPSSATLTNATGLPVSTGISGLGTSVATALAVNVGSSGAVVVNGGALGTPSSGTVTNLTGTASININGTVGATTANTGSFTSLTSTGAMTFKQPVEAIYDNGNSGAATLTPNAANGSVQKYTLTGNITLNAFGTPVAGQSITLILVQDGTGSRTLTSTMKWSGGTKTLSTAANSIDIATIYYDGTNYYASLAKGFA